MIAPLVTVTVTVSLVTFLTGYALVTLSLRVGVQQILKAVAVEYTKYLARPIIFTREDSISWSQQGF